MLALFQMAVAPIITVRVLEPLTNSLVVTFFLRPFKSSLGQARETCVYPKFGGETNLFKIRK